MSNLDFIYKRKSIRKFKDEKVPREDILEMLKAATYAPSPKNQQNWHFVVLQNSNVINKIVDIVTESHKYIASLAKTELESQKYMRFLKYYIAFKDAPVLVMVYCNEYEMIEEKILRESNVDEAVIKGLLSSHSAVQAIGAAVENFLLAASSVGYGACYMTGPTHAKGEIEKFIGFNKEGYSLMSMIALGVPADKTTSQPARKPLEDVVTFMD